MFLLLFSFAQWPRDTHLNVNKRGELLTLLYNPSKGTLQSVTSSKCAAAFRLPLGWSGCGRHSRWACTPVHSVSALGPCAEGEKPKGRRHQCNQSREAGWVLGLASLSLLPQSKRGQSLKLPSCLPLVSDGLCSGRRGEQVGGLLLLLLQFRKLWGESARWRESPLRDTCPPQGFLSLSIQETLPMSWTLEKTTGSTSSSAHAPCSFDLIFQLMAWRLKVSTGLDRERRKDKECIWENVVCYEGYLSRWAKCLRSRKTLWKAGTWCFGKAKPCLGPGETAECHGFILEIE